MYKMPPKKKTPSGSSRRTTTRKTTTTKPTNNIDPSIDDIDDSNNIDDMDVSTINDNHRNNQTNDNDDEDDIDNNDDQHQHQRKKQTTEHRNDDRHNNNNDHVPIQHQQQQQQQQVPPQLRHTNNIHTTNIDPNTCRILLSTDNHLGYAERDSIRGLDSFAAFEEILYLGKYIYHVDFILFAGDVFHDNRPTRQTIYKTMEIVRRYCMGPNPIQIQILSNTTTTTTSMNTRSINTNSNQQQQPQRRTNNNNSNNNNTRHPRSLSSSTTTMINYMDPNYSVDLPIFAIHGNHDDPSRDQGGSELLAALVNYFGRQEEVDHIVISPILFQKGTTKIALYGLGSLRDERLNRMWEKQKVQFLRPDDDDDDDDENENDEDDDDDTKGFFNIFALHQNRDLGRGTKNCVQESMIPEWMDVVVWGHEHECLIEFFESVVGTFRITQPGSSVATSLVPGEAVQKKIGILDIKGKKFRLHPVPLTQVRTFVMTEISLREHRSNLDPDDAKVDEKINKVLEEEVQLMVMSARDKAEETLRDARAAGNTAADDTSIIKYKLQRPEDVLVRLRVDHAGFSTINNQRFGAKFVGKVANPSDILLFHRKKDPKLASTVKKQGIKPIAPEELERVNMEDLVREHLVSMPEGKLNIYGEQDLSEALEEYVDKNLTAAISDIASDRLNTTQKNLIKVQKRGEHAVIKDSQIIEVLDRDNKAKNTHSETRTRSIPEAPTSRKANIPSNNESMIDDDEALGEESEIVEEPSMNRSSSLHAAAAAARPKRGGSSRKVMYALDESDDDELVSDEIVDSDDDDVEKDDDDIEDDDEYDAPGTNKKRAATKRRDRTPITSSKSTRPKTLTASSKGRVTSGKRTRPIEYNDSSDDDVQHNRKIADSADIDVDWGTAATKTQRNSQW